MGEERTIGISIRELVECLPDALLVIDVDGVILFANERSEDVFGYGKGELDGMCVDFLLPQRQRSLHREHRLRYAGSPHARSMGATSNLVGHRKDGTDFAAEVSLSPFRVGDALRVVAAIRDVTHKRHLLREVSDSRERMAALLSSMSDGLIASNACGRVTEVNPEAERLLGAPLTDLVGRPLPAVLRLRDTVTLEPIDLPLDCRQPSARLVASFDEAILDRPDGERRHVMVSVATVVGAGRQGEGTVVLLRDVAERRELQKRAQVSEQLASLGVVAAGIGHEITSPLTYALGNAELVSRTVDKLVRREGESAEAFAERAHEELGRVSTSMGEVADALARIQLIVGDLRQLAHPEPVEGARCRLLDVLGSALRICRSDLIRRARLDTELHEASGLFVEGAAARLGQVFINLLVNAAQAFADPREPQSLVRLRVWVDRDRFAVVQIEDNGAGIPEEHRARVFDPFFTTKAEGEGTGLGLSICERIVSDLGGRIDLSSEVGRGTTVCVRLPLIEGSVVNAAPDRECSPPACVHR